MTLADAVREVAATGLDACTLNNALNVVQLAVLVALLRWTRGTNPAGEGR